MSPYPPWPLTPLSSQIRCMLNIWGVILYLRLPWITAQAGIGECPWQEGKVCLNVGCRDPGPLQGQRAGWCGRGARDTESAGPSALPLSKSLNLLEPVSTTEHPG